MATKERNVLFFCLKILECQTVRQFVAGGGSKGAPSQEHLDAGGVITHTPLGSSEQHQLLLFFSHT